MLPFLQYHPFAVEAHFERSIVLTFAAPKEQLQPLLPPCLSLDTWDNKWGFMAIAMVQTKHLRPKGFPKWMGNDFFLIGYRLFTRYTNLAGKNLRGLYILKSETDKKKMEYLGNLFTKYRYTTTDITQSIIETVTQITSNQSGLNIEYAQDQTNAALPVGSPFSQWKEARRFAGPLPFTFSYIPHKQSVLIVEGVRQFWEPQPIALLNYDVQFPTILKGCTLQLASTFMVENIPYHWKKGRLEKWNTPESPLAA